MYDKKERRQSLPEIWRDQARRTRELLDHQNAGLLSAAKERDRLLWLIGEWAVWRAGQCDSDELSPAEESLMEVTRCHTI